MAERLATIPVSKIRENTEALRTEVLKESEQYIDLVNSIKAFGFTSSIRVREEHDEATGELYYRLVDGLHRYSAACEVGLTELPALITDMAADKVLAAQIAANACRVDTTPAQFAAALKRMQQLNPSTLEQLGEAVGKSKSWVEKTLKLNKLTPTIAKLVDEGKIVVTNAVALADLPPDKQEEYVHAAMTESPALFGPRMTETLKEIRSAAKQGRVVDNSFRPIPTPRKTTAFKEVLDEAAAGVSSTIKSLLDAAGVNDPYEAALLAVKWAMSLDPQSVEIQKAKWEQEQQGKKDKKEAAAKERQAKKEAEATKELAKVAA